MAHDQARQWAALGSEAVEGRYAGQGLTIRPAIYMNDAAVEHFEKILEAKEIKEARKIARAYLDGEW